MDIINPIRFEVICVDDGMRKCMGCGMLMYDPRGGLSHHCVDIILLASPSTTVGCEICGVAIHPINYLPHKCGHAIDDPETYTELKEQARWLAEELRRAYREEQERAADAADAADPVKTKLEVLKDKKAKMKEKENKNTCVREQSDKPPKTDEQILRELGEFDKGRAEKLEGKGSKPRRKVVEKIQLVEEADGTSGEQNSRKGGFEPDLSVLEAENFGSCSENQAPVEAADEPTETTKAAGESETAEEEAAEKIETTNLSDLLVPGLMKGLKQAYESYSEAHQTSDESISASRLDNCRNLANQMALLSLGSPSESSTLHLKIVKSGINYAFVNAPDSLSFLTHAIIVIASKLSKADLLDVLENLKVQTEHVTLDEDRMSWSPYLGFVGMLQSWVNTMNKEDIFGGSSEDKDTSFDLLYEVAVDPFGEGGYEDPICELYVRKAEEGCSNIINTAFYDTGRKGEEEAFVYFASKFRDKIVTWENWKKESHLPYDLSLEPADKTIEAADKTTEYVEVKTTSVADKNFFFLSLNELHFADKMGASYVIAHVLLSDGQLERIITYRDPVRLLRSKKLKLALHICRP